MDNFDDFSIVNLDDDRDVNSSADESGSDEPIDLGDQNEPEDLDVGDEQYKRVADLTADEILGLEFGSEDEGWQFYQTYAKCHGFVVRKDDVRRDVKGNIIMRQLVCNREGLRNKKHFMRVDRKREHKPITRTKCQAKLRVQLNQRTSKWIVVSFEESHNHELIASKFVHLIPAYRVMNDVDKAQVDSLHSYGVRACYIMGYMVAQKEGYSGVGFSKKDLYNYIDRQKHGQIKNVDAHAALCYLQGKADNDPIFFSKYTTSVDGRLEHLFWADGGSRADFQCFGDVLAFDTTHKKNIYNYPLAILSGCNHHSQTTIFGCALLSSETTETYKWVLEAFLEAMCNKHPKAVVTNGDGAMEAIKQVFPDASHRFCAWQLHNNVCENVKSSPFLEDFKTAMYSNFTPDQFEEYWKKMVGKHGLVGNKWVCKTYENKSLWATAYLRDKYFARIRTTSRCEAINSIIKTCVRKKSTIVEFMHNFEQALREYRNNELIADFKSLYTEPVMTTSLYKIEKEASNIYTQEIFKEVKHEIEKAGALIVTERAKNGEKLMFKMNKYCEPCSEIHVVYDTVKSSFICDCRLFESRGIPCAHIICAMKNEHVGHIPSSLICKRWTKTAKSDCISSDQLEEIDFDGMYVSRFGALVASCNRLCHIAAKKSEYFSEIMGEILKLTYKFEMLGGPHSTHNSSVKDISNPTLVKTKGVPRKKKFARERRHCSGCGGTGHTIRRCPMVLGTHDQSTKDDELSPSESVDICKESGSDKEVTTCDENNDHDVVLTNQSTRHNDNKGQEKLSGGCKRKEKKVEGSTQNSAKHPKIEPFGCSSGGKDDIRKRVSMLPPTQPLMHIPTFGYGTMSQGGLMFPHFGGVPVSPQIPQVPAFPQFPQYFTGVPNANNGTSRNGFLQEVIKNGDQTSVKCSYANGVFEK